MTSCALAICVTLIELVSAPIAWPATALTVTTLLSDETGWVCSVPPETSVLSEVEKAVRSLEIDATDEICAVLAVCLVVIADSVEVFCAAVRLSTSEPVSMLAPLALRLDRMLAPTDAVLVVVVAAAAATVVATLDVALVELVVVMKLSFAFRNDRAAKNFTARSPHPDHFLRRRGVARWRRRDAPGRAANARPARRYGGPDRRR